MYRRTYKPTRKALLIAATGSPYLQGVNIDVHNFQQFLLSDNGGRFYENEIVVLNDPTKLDVLIELCDEGHDYSLIYYSGHGFIQNETQFLRLADGSFSENNFVLKKTKKQTIIIDACRNFVQRPRPLNGIDQYGDIWENLEGSLTRNHMDSFIRNSPDGINVAYATKRGSSARDSQKGGIFTSNLLTAAWSTQRFDGKITYWMLDQIVEEASPEDYSARHLDIQIPEFQNVTGNLYVPFAFGL